LSGAVKMDLDEIQLEAEDKMEQTLEVFKEEARGIRGGRATPGLVENIRVEYYGNMTPLRQIANIGIPDPRLIVIKPYDPNSIGPIQKAIMTSELGINPTSDGKLVRLPIPPLSEETRKHTVQAVKKLAEQSRQSIRNIRRDANKHIDKAKSDSEITEDEAYRGKDEIQKLTDKFIEDIDKVLEAKVNELMEV